MKNENPTEEQEAIAIANNVADERIAELQAATTDDPTHSYPLPHIQRAYPCGIISNSQT
jgi:hypothetical protein